MINYHSLARYTEGCLSGRKEPPAKRLRASPPSVGSNPTPSAIKNAPVAQLDRVSDYESEGHRFESCRARHFENYKRF